MTGVLRSAIARAFRRTALPLASYYAITLGVPLANGAARSGSVFGEHALVVLAVPPLAIVLGSAGCSIARMVTTRLPGTARG